MTDIPPVGVGRVTGSRQHESFASREQVARTLGRVYEAEVDRRFVELLRPVHHRVLEDG